jgi:hypothetical protein
MEVRMKKALLFLVPLLCVFAFQCSNNPVNEGKNISPQDSAQGDNLATKWFQAISDTLATLDKKDEAGIKATDLSAIRAGFNSALAHNSRNSIAHLGLSILEILELNYSADVWAVVDSLEAWGGGVGPILPAPAGNHRGGVIIGHQFTLLATMPLNGAMRTVAHFPPNVTISHIQDIIQQTIMPALSRAINHLAIVEQNTKAHVTVKLHHGSEMETVIIDLGEIYFFDGSVHALRAAFGFGIAYDYDFLGPDGTYGWIDDIARLSRGSDCPPFTRKAAASGDTLDVVYAPDGTVEIDSVMLAIAHYNLAQRSGFLALRQGGTVLSAAGLDLAAVIAKLQDSVNFIKHVRTGETEQNVIKLSDLTDLESGLHNPNGPNFAKNFNSIEDVLSWVSDLARDRKSVV